MRLLLDTHALLWWLAGDERMPLRARAAIDDAQAEQLVLISNETVFDRYGVVRIPTMNVYVTGEVVNSLAGAMPKPRLLRELEDYIAS